MLVKNCFNRNNSNLYTNDSGEFTFNRFTGAFSSSFPVALVTPLNFKSKDRIFITRAIGVRGMRQEDGKPVRITGAKARITHYSVTVIDNKETLLIASDGLETAYFYLVNGVVFEYHVKVGVFELESAYATLLRELATTPRPYAYRFWKVANEFIIRYIGDRIDDFRIPETVIRSRSGDYKFEITKADEESGTLETKVTNVRGNGHPRHLSICVTHHPLLQVKEENVGEAIENVDKFIKHCMLRDGGIDLNTPNEEGEVVEEVIEEELEETLETNSEESITNDTSSEEGISPIDAEIRDLLLNQQNGPTEELEEVIEEDKRSHFFFLEEEDASSVRSDFDSHGGTIGSDELRRVEDEVDSEPLGDEEPSEEDIEDEDVDTEDMSDTLVVENKDSNSH